MEGQFLSSWDKMTRAQDSAGCKYERCAQVIAHLPNFLTGGPWVLPCRRRCQCSQRQSDTHIYSFNLVLNVPKGSLHVSKQSESPEHQLCVYPDLSVKFCLTSSSSGFLALVLSQVLCCRLVLNLMAAREERTGSTFEASGDLAFAGPASRSNGGVSIPLGRYRDPNATESLSNDVYAPGVKIQVSFELFGSAIVIVEWKF